MLFALYLDKGFEAIRIYKDDLSCPQADKLTGWNADKLASVKASKLNRRKAG